MGSCAARSVWGRRTAATLMKPIAALITSRLPVSMRANTAGSSSGTVDTRAALNSYSKRARAMIVALCIVGVAPTTPARTVMKNLRTPTPISSPLTSSIPSKSSSLFAALGASSSSSSSLPSASHAPSIPPPPPAPPPILPEPPARPALRSMLRGISTRRLNACCRVRALVSLVATMSSPSNTAKEDPWAPIATPSSAESFSVSRSIRLGRIAATHRRRYLLAAGAHMPDPSTRDSSAASLLAESQSPPRLAPGPTLGFMSAARSLYARFCTAASFSRAAGRAALNTRSRAALSKPGTMARDRSMKVHLLADRVSPPSLSPSGASSASDVTLTSLRRTVRKKPPSAAVSVICAKHPTVALSSPRRSGGAATKRLKRMGRKLRAYLATVAA